MKAYLYIGLGTLLGGAARHLSHLIAESINPGGFPWDTVAVNLLGSFLIGLFAAWFFARRGLAGNTHWEHFLITGFCGGFTTFSILSWQAIDLWMNQAQLTAAGFAAGNVLGSLISVTLGFALAHSMLELRGDSQQN